MTNDFVDGMLEAALLVDGFGGDTLDKHRAANAIREFAKTIPSPAGPDALAEELLPRAGVDVVLDSYRTALEHTGQWTAATAVGECMKRVGKITALCSRPAQDRDAERYRWFRARYMGTEEQLDEINSLNSPGPMPTTPEEFDAAIDAAMSQQEKHDG